MTCIEFNALSMLRWRWMQKKEVCVHRSTLVAATVQRKIKTKQTLFIILANIFALYVSPFLLMPLTEVKVLKSASQCFRFKSLVHSICCDTRKSWTRSCVSFSKWNHSLFAWTWFSCFGEKKQTFKRFSVPAALMLCQCWCAFSHLLEWVFSESSKSFYSQKVNVQCMCTLYMYSSYVNAPCKAIKILCVFKGLVINNFFSTNLFMPLPLIWVYLCAPGFHYFSVWIYWHQANKPTPNAAQSKWFFEKFICSFLNFNYVKVKEKIPMLTSPFFEAQTMQYSSP